MEVVMDKDLKCWIELHNTFPLNKILKKEIKLPLDDKGAEYIFNNVFAELEENFDGEAKKGKDIVHLNRVKDALLKMGFKAPAYTEWRLR